MSSFDTDGFLEHFLLPLAAGGELRVREPIDSNDLAMLNEQCATASDLTVRIEAARQDTAASCWLYPINTEVDEVTLRLAIGLHNVLFLSHPGHRGWLHLSRRSTLQRVIDFTDWCLDVGPPANEDELVARHTVVSRVADLERTDTELRFWVGRRSFTGMAPPARLTAWPGLRRVRQQEQVVNWISSELSDDQRALVDSLLANSPLTSLLSPLRGFPHFSVAELYPYLLDRDVARVVAARFLELGLDKVGPVLARDFWRIVAAPSAQQSMPPKQLERLEQVLATWGSCSASVQLPLRLMAGLVQYLYATQCMSPDPAPLAVLAGQQATDALCSVLVAAEACGLLADPGDEAVGRRMNELVATARQALGDATPKLARMLRGALVR